MTYDDDDRDYDRLMADDGPSVIDDDLQELEGICPACNGSGEGMIDGSTCSTCHGEGEA